MNNFNNVFLAVKKHCGQGGSVEGDGCFESIAADANIPIAKIDFFLSTLQGLQLLDYSLEHNFIKLTTYGRKQERLFSEV